MSVMRRIALASLILFLVAIISSCARPDGLEISVKKTVNGIIIENRGGVACTVFVSRADGQEQFDLAAGEARVITDTPEPIDISAVRK